MGMSLDVEALGSDKNFLDSDGLFFFLLVTFLDGDLLAEEILFSDKKEEQSLAFLSQKMRVNQCYYIWTHI